MAKLTELHTFIDQFNELFPRPNMPALQVSGICNVTDPSIPWPDADKPGVYALLENDDEVVYVGKASCNRVLGYRLRDHFDRYGKPKQEYFAEVTSFVVIAFPPDRAFEAPAAEEYLIAKLNPPKNGTGRTT
jgi:hypothetical protein